MKTGKLFLVGIGPGDKEHMTFRAMQAIEECEVIVGYKTYTKLIKNLLDGKTVISSPMRDEEERCRLAFDAAREGKNTALISGGDPGIYGMAGIALQLLDKEGLSLEVEIVPGVTAANAAAAILGAPLMHDFAVISLSDLLTPWELIKKRLHMAGEGDFIVVLYNPRSRGRVTQIEEAQGILSRYRGEETPVGIVRNAFREGESKTVTVLGQMLEHDMDMATVVVIGNSQSYIRDGKFITPRGYLL